jgi:PAS domain S-box-containing protein
MADLDQVRPAFPLLDSLQAGVTLLDQNLELVWANQFFKSHLAQLEGFCGTHCFAGLRAGERRCEDCLPPRVQRSRTLAEAVRTTRDDAGNLAYYRVLVQPIGANAELLCTMILPLPADEMERDDRWRERFLLSAIRGSNDGIFAADRTGTVRFWNRGAEHIIGWRIQEMVGQPISRLLPEGNDPEAAAVFGVTDTPTSLTNRELRAHTRDRGDISVEVTRSPLHDGSGSFNGYSFVVRDVSERKRTLEKMVFTERMNAVGNMAAALAHEINNPLGIISGNAEVLMLDLEEQDPRREDLSTIIRETDRISELVRGLLRFARPEQPEMEAVLAEDVLRRVERLVHHASHKQRTRIDLEIEMGLPSLWGDAHQLEQVVLNLAMNALQAIANGGVVLFSARARQRPGDDGRSRSGVELAVADTGPGLPPGAGDRIFEPFFTTKTNGTGLGLAVCRNLVHEHGGTITASDRPEGGAVFTVWLPALGAQARARGAGALGPTPQSPS